MRFLKKLIRKLVFGHKADSQSYIEYLRGIGCRVGERTQIFSPNNVLIDETRPWLIEIGDDVQITQGVTILTHGFDWAVIKGVYGEILGSAGKVKIGSNVFIGMNSTILKGVTVGDNVIIGAGSLVNKDIPDNCVAVGNPARVVMSLGEYRKKRKEAQFAEAAELVREYRSIYKKEASEEELSEFFWLFTDSPENIPICWERQMENLGNVEFSRKKLSENRKQFADMEDFLSIC